MGNTYREIPAWYKLWVDWWEAKERAEESDSPVLAAFVPPKPDVSGSNWPTIKVSDEWWQEYGHGDNAIRKRAEVSGWRRRNKVRVEKGMEPEPYPKTYASDWSDIPH